MILEQLLGDMSCAHFMEHYYLKRPLARPGGCQHFTDRLGWPLVAHLLAQPEADLLAARPEKVWSGAERPTLEQAQALLAEGYTLRIRKAELHDPTLAAMAADFRRAFAGAVDIHLYCTPADNPGLSWHYDAEDVFIFQTSGSKTWWVRKNTVHPWPLAEAIPTDMRYEREVMPTMQCLLQAGDWLYVPGGFWHRTQAGEQSISLSLGVMAATALDVYDFLRTRLLQSLQWRQRLPSPGEAAPSGEEGLRQQYRELFQELGRNLAEQFGSEELVDSFIQARRHSG